MLRSICALLSATLLTACAATRTEPPDWESSIQRSIRQLQAPLPNDRIEAVNRLSFLNISEAAPEIAMLLADDESSDGTDPMGHPVSSSPAEFAAHALVTFGSASVQPLLRGLQSDSPRMRARAADVLGSIGDARAVDPLLRALRDSERDVRLSAIDALGKIGDPRAMEPLRDLLRHPDPIFQEFAAEALASIANKQEPIQQR